MDLRDVYYTKFIQLKMSTLRDSLKAMSIYVDKEFVENCAIAKQLLKFNLDESPNFLLFGPEGNHSDKIWAAMSKHLGLVKVSRNLEDAAFWETERSFEFDLDTCNGVEIIPFITKICMSQHVLKQRQIIVIHNVDRLKSQWMLQLLHVMEGSKALFIMDTHYYSLISEGIKSRTLSLRVKAADAADATESYESWFKTNIEKKPSGLDAQLDQCWAYLFALDRPITHIKEIRAVCNKLMYHNIRLAKIFYSLINYYQTTKNKTNKTNKTNNDNVEILWSKAATLEGLAKNAHNDIIYMEVFILDALTLK